MSKLLDFEIGEKIRIEPVETEKYKEHQGFTAHIYREDGWLILEEKGDYSEIVHNSEMAMDEQVDNQTDKHEELRLSAIQAIRIRQLTEDKIYELEISTGQTSIKVYSVKKSWLIALKNCVRTWM